MCIRDSYNLQTSPAAECSLQYRVFGDGRIQTTLHYDPVEGLAAMPEFGVLFKIDADYDTVEWYGNGPAETYWDRQHGAKLGIYQNKVADNMAQYLSLIHILIYLTNTVGLNPGIVGTLIAVSKLLDGVTDIFFGSLIDKTHSKMGKARPWMLYGYIGCAITLVAIFAIPTNLGQFAQYAWFLIAYTCLLYTSH